MYPHRIPSTVVTPTAPAGGAVPLRDFPLRRHLVYPRWFVIPFIAIHLVLLTQSLESTRRTDRWASICFLTCALLLFHQRLPPLFATMHPAGHPGGACWDEVQDLLAADDIAGN
jgi:hypothetical protein